MSLSSDNLNVSSPLSPGSSDAAQLSHKVPTNVVAVFVARFDVTSGNTIEWQHPEEIDLSGVEYQVISSGLHNIESDTIYFTKSPYIGVGLYKKEKAAASDRGAIMRSVGIILEPSDNLGPCAKVWAHAEALKSLDPFASPNELRKTMRRYYDDHLRHHNHHQKPPTTMTAWEHNPLEADANHVRHIFDAEALLYDNHHPPSIFDQLLSLSPYPLEPLPSLVSLPMFIAHLGPQVFVLWKAAVLRKRILFLTEPPMSHVAGYVYDTFLLSAVPSKYQCKRKFTLKYTVSVNDIPDLADNPDGFVASTSDAIYETKTDLYDVLVKLPKIEENHYHHQQHGFPKTIPAIHSTCAEIDPRHNAADLIRFRSILRQLFDTARHMGFAEDMDIQLGDALERAGDAMDAISVAMFQLTLWWFRPSSRQHSKPSATGRSTTSWERIFAGSSASGESVRRLSGQARKRQGSRTLLENISMDREEQEHLLLGDSIDLEEDEQDATELSTSEVFHVVTARRSSSSSSSSTHHGHVSKPQTPTSVQEKLTGAFVGFFHALTWQILSKLGSILSANESDQSGIVTIYPRDMIQLGLHPRLDAAFVAGLADVPTEGALRL
ncbi:hypothetical protein BX666DRAFT_2025176 [Dichotomocladium elegans]|nr:hypothetical protein BX666DRAFT_2025176 [Dichotomocladium elegans]